jgi:hypothetical protein
MNYHIDKDLLQQGEIFITIEGKPIDEYTLNEIINELNEIFHEDERWKDGTLISPTAQELYDEIVRMLMELEKEWKELSIEENPNKIMTIHDYLIIKKFEDLKGTEDLPF